MHPKHCISIPQGEVPHTDSQEDYKNHSLIDSGGGEGYIWLINTF